MTRVNPIASIGSTSSVGTLVKCPCSYQWDLQDISASDAGRTEDGLMHKNRVAQKVKLSLAWWGLTTAEASAVLSAFNAEYLYVRYLDPRVGGFTTKYFYVGDRSAPLYNASHGLWENISFNIIER